MGCGCQQLRRLRHSTGHSMPVQCGDSGAVVSPSCSSHSGGCTNERHDSHIARRIPHPRRRNASALYKDFSTISTAILACVGLGSTGSSSRVRSTGSPAWQGPHDDEPRSHAQRTLTCSVGSSHQPQHLSPSGWVSPARLGCSSWRIAATFCTHVPPLALTADAAAGGAVGRQLWAAQRPGRHCHQVHRLGHQHRGPAGVQGAASRAGLHHLPRTCLLHGVVRRATWPPCGRTGPESGRLFPRFLYQTQAPPLWLPRTCREG